MVDSTAKQIDYKTPGIEANMKKIERIDLFFKRIGQSDFNKVTETAISVYPNVSEFEAIENYYHSVKDEVQIKNRSNRVSNGQSDLTNEIIAIQCLP